MALMDDDFIIACVGIGAKEGSRERAERVKENDEPSLQRFAGSRRRRAS